MPRGRTSLLRRGAPDCESGQQRSVLPLHFPRCAGCRRDADYRRNEDGLCARDCGDGARGGDERGGGDLCRSGAFVRPGVSDSKALRSPSDSRHCAGRCPRQRWIAASPPGRLPIWRLTDSLKGFIYRTGVGMRAVFDAARTGAPKRIVFAEGEDERVLQAAQISLRKK